MEKSLYDVLMKKITKLNGSLPFILSNKLQGIKNDKFMRELADELKLLITDKHSPWNSTSMTWSNEIEKIALKYAFKGPMSGNEMLEYFDSLIFENDVTILDEKTKYLISLKILILIGNQLEIINGKNLPKKLEILNVAHNNLKQLVFKDASFPALVYFNVGHNLISECGWITYKSFPELIYLDLCYNDIYHLEEVIGHLKYLIRLTVLNLKGNPCWLVSGYRGFILQNLPLLRYLDDENIIWKECHEIENWLKDGESFNYKEAILRIETLRILNMKQPISQIVNIAGASTIKEEWNYFVEFKYPCLDSKLSTESIKISKNKDEDEHQISLFDNVYQTPSFPWLEIINIQDICDLKFSNLHGLLDLLKKHLEVCIMEKYTQSTAFVPNGTKTKNDIQYLPLSSMVTVVGKFLVPLKSLLNGQSEIQAVWTSNNDYAELATENLKRFAVKVSTKETKIKLDSKDKKTLKIGEILTPTSSVTGLHDELTCHMIIQLLRQNYLTTKEDK